MVAERLDELARRAPAAGRLAGDGVRTGRGDHPACGDTIELDLRVVDGRITELAWRASGCPATLAVAASLEGAWRAASIADAARRLHERLAALGGLRAHEHHAEKLALRALDAALLGSAP